MIEAGLTQSRRAAKVGIESDPAVLRVFVPSCESIFYDHDSARSGDIGDDQETWLQTTVTGPGTLTFDYKLSCDAGDEYAFSIDGQYRSGRAGSQDWTESGPWTITGAGTHTIRWKFIKDSSGSSGSDCLWIDRIRWTGAMPDGEGWDRIEYAYDAAGRRIEKKVDGATQVKYVYDGDHIIAEYNSAGTLLRKYVHGPCVDEPICMIEASGTYAGTHYYHYDALGSCVAMTNSAGNVVQLYEYSVYGQVAASDADHPNRFMFTGREFDKDTGLYYYRTRYYHPEIGRFLQTDPIGYGDGMNWYAYCGNNPIGLIDPSGCYATSMFDPQTLWYTFTARIPARALMDDVPARWDQCFELVDKFFRQAGMYDLYPGWFMCDLDISGEGDWQYFTIQWRSIAYNWEGPEPSKPTIDGSILLTPGGGDSVSIVAIDDKRILTNRLLQKLMKPELDRIDALPKCNQPNVGSWYTPGPLFPSIRELLTWDSCLVNDTHKYTFRLGFDEYEGGEVNYFAGGYLMAHYGIGWTTAMDLLFAHKGAVRGLSPSSPLKNS